MNPLGHLEEVMSRARTQQQPALPVVPPQPVQKPNPLGEAFGAFARGFAPQQTAAIDEQQKAAKLESSKKALAWVQQTAAQPVERRAQFTIANAQRIAADTGQPVEAIIQSAQNPQAFSDQAMQEAIAGLSAGLGVGPAPPQKPEAYTLAPGAQRYEGDKMVADNPRATPDEKPPNWPTVQLEDGVYAYNPQNPHEMMKMGPAPAKGNGVQMQFGEGGTLSGLTIGGTGTKGKEPAVIRGPDGQPVVSSGPQQLASNKSWNALQDYEAGNKIVLEDIDRALKKSGFWTTGVAGSVLKGVPGTPAFDENQLLDTIKANIGFDKLAAMRAQSPTGGALGQVSDFENKLLQSVMGALEQSQGTPQFEYNLNRLKDILADTQGRRRAAFAQDYPNLAQYAGFAAGAKEQGQQLNNVTEGSRIRNPTTGEELVLQNGQWMRAQ